MRSASAYDIKEDKALRYFPPKIKPNKAFLELDEKKIASIEQELKNPKNPKVIQYIKERLNGNPYGRYSKELFDCPYGLIYGKKGLYAIYNEDTQFEAAPEGRFGKIKYAMNLRTHEWLILKTQIIKSSDGSTEDYYENEHAVLEALELTEEPIMLRSSSENPDKLKGFLLMKYLKGKDLYDLFNQKIDKKNPMSKWPDVFWLHVCIRVTEALIKVHGKSILHRDIKFENILFDIINDEANILDFGNSKIIAGESIKDLPPRLSLPGFNAPENFHSKYSAKSEIFALSNIFEAFLRNNIPLAIISGKNPSLRGIPQFEPYKQTIFTYDKDVKLFLQKMRENDINERPTLTEVLKFLHDTYQKHTSDKVIGTIQRILSESQDHEKIRLEETNKAFETAKLAKQRPSRSLFSIFNNLSINLDENQPETPISSKSAYY